MRPTKKPNLTMNKGPNSGVKLSVSRPRGATMEAYRVIAGQKTYKRAAGEKIVSRLGAYGKKGTMDFVVNEGEAEVFRSVPEHEQHTGIGTDLLLAAENMARKMGIPKVVAGTSNPQAIKTYKRAGWKYVSSYTNNGKKMFVYQKMVGAKK